MIGLEQLRLESTPARSEECYSAQQPWHSRATDGVGSCECAFGECTQKTALARIRRSARKTYVSSSRDEDRALCNEVATTYSELGKLLDSLGRRTKAQNSYKNEKKWGYIIKSRISNCKTILRIQCVTEGVSSCQANHPLTQTTSSRLRLQIPLQVPP
ncbi:hypothetical protein EDD21DRAFT_355900 [Dissophora ornata]|nr:hypothetical protein EDD21DRAFT_355900 [Dissophora ornata]